jgi:predicted  nucleic acid-binding Zn-ribbon protein
MTKSDFRATQSLAADLMRIEDSLVKNQKEMLSSFKNIKNIVSEIKNHHSDVREFKENVSNLTSELRDHIENIENDMIGLDGVDLFDFKNSPDDVIINLRKCSDYVNNLDMKIEENLKLIVKAKGNGALQDEIDLTNKEVHSLLNTSEEFISTIEASIKGLLDEIKSFKAHSKDLLQHKII